MLSDPKYTIVILHRVSKTALTAPWKGLPYQFQRRCSPRSEYAAVIFWGCFTIVQDLYKRDRAIKKLKIQNVGLTIDFAHEPPDIKYRSLTQFRTTIRTHNI